jgi:hypothetical protein
VQDDTWHMVKFLEQATQGQALNIGPYRAAMVKLYPQQERAFVAQPSKSFTRPTADTSARFPYAQYTMQYIANKIYEAQIFVEQLEHLQMRRPLTEAVARHEAMKHYLPDAKRSIRAGYALLALANDQYQLAEKQHTTGIFDERHTTLLELKPVIYSINHQRRVRFESLDGILRSVKLRIQMKHSSPLGATLINLSSDPYFTEIPPTEAERSGAAWGAYAFEDIDGPTINWAQPLLEDTLSEEAILKTIGPDIAACILEQGSLRQLFQRHIMGPENLDISWGKALESVIDDLPGVFAANGAESLEAITKRFFDDENNHNLLPELIRNVKGLNQDFLLVRARAFYKYTGLGFRVKQLVDRAANKARDFTNNSEHAGAADLTADLAIQLMYEGSKARRGALLSTIEGTDSHGPIDHAYLTLKGTSAELRYPVIPLEERTTAIEQATSAIARRNTAEMGDLKRAALLREKDVGNPLTQTQLDSHNKRVTELTSSLSAHLVNDSKYSAQLQTELAVTRRVTAMLEEQYTNVRADLMSSNKELQALADKRLTEVAQGTAKVVHDTITALSKEVKSQVEGIRTALQTHTGGAKLTLDENIIANEQQKTIDRLNTELATATSKLKEAKACLGFIDPLFVKSVRSNMNFNHHVQNKQRDPHYYFYPEKWDTLALTGEDNLPASTQPDEDRLRLQLGDPSRLNPETQTRALHFTDTAEDRAKNLALRKKEVASVPPAEPATTALQRLMSMASGEPITSSAPTDDQVLITEITAGDMFSGDTGAEPAGISACLGHEPTTERQQVVNFLTKIRAPNAQALNFVEIPYNHSLHHKQLTPAAQQRTSATVHERTVFTTYTKDNFSLFSKNEVRQVFEVAKGAMRPKSLLIGKAQEKHYSFQNFHAGQYARALYRHDGNNGDKYEWIPTDNKTDGAYFEVKEAFNNQQIPLSRSTLLGSKKEVKGLSKSLLYNMAMYIPNAQIGHLGNTIATQCTALGIQPRSLYAELNPRTDRKHGRVTDIHTLMRASKSENMEDYEEQIVTAIQATTTAYNACGYFLPAHVLNLHIRRLQRLKRAARAANREDYQQTDSDGSADSNTHTPYRPPKRKHATSPTPSPANSTRPPPNKHYQASYTAPPTPRGVYTSYAERRIPRSSSPPSQKRRTQDSRFNTRSAQERRPRDHRVPHYETPRRQRDQGERR